MSKEKKAELKKKVDTIMQGSTTPDVFKKVMAVAEDENASVNDLKTIIEHDPVIVTKVLSMANGAYFWFPRKISSVSQAILVLGFNMVKTLAVSTSIFSGLSAGNMRAVNMLWSHSFIVGVASGLIAKESMAVDSDSAFITGLLHDIGRVVMFQIFGEEYLKVSGDTREGLLQREEKVFGASHPEVGGWLAERINLPEGCVRSITFHHNPSECPVDKEDPALEYLPHVVYLADFIVSDTGRGLDSDCEVSQNHAWVLQSIGMENKILEILEEVKERVEELRLQECS
ncbi:MAG: HDOD domain-containing protein [Thermodesulfobacteriota bacterium]